MDEPYVDALAVTVPDSAPLDPVAGWEVRWADDLGSLQGRYLKVRKWNGKSCYRKEVACDNDGPFMPDLHGKRFSS